MSFMISITIFLRVGIYMYLMIFQRHCLSWLVTISYTTWWVITQFSIDLSRIGLVSSNNYLFTVPILFTTIQQNNYELREDLLNFYHILNISVNLETVFKLTPLMSDEYTERSRFSKYNDFSTLQYQGFFTCLNDY